MQKNPQRRPWATAFKKFRRQQPYKLIVLRAVKRKLRISGTFVQNPGRVSALNEFALMLAPDSGLP